jgi:hypothetical protein
MGSVRWVWSLPGLIAIDQAWVLFAIGGVDRSVVVLVVLGSCIAIDQAWVLFAIGGFDFYFLCILFERVS